ncbi:class I SAM-dependent methyltransferase [Anaerosalibacter massiliensis]|uniref:Class I SAM-dependent methyltransferase n=1 Tax=Anaerosalibacter massiliensis TaxID=1347392 RepID=A0A9X2MNC5_9FIRM|nr:class I SAM-dependent methyltransferase [Anaerosalibacter massiliensis]MCR2044196.1 class I SAM-dependent methyltransferase [Anaerosalibacter massiliensis]
MANINRDSVSLDSYEKMAKYYFKEVDTKSFNAYYERPGLTSIIGDVEGMKVLDAGCAAGWYTNWLLEKGADEVIAIDFSPKMIDMTKIRVKDKENVKVIQHDLNNSLDFIENRSLDLIVSSLTIHYIKDLKRVFKNFYEKLKPDGRVVFSCHHPFLDFMLFEKEDYFKLELVEDEWETSIGTIQVDFYTRPLSKILEGPLSSGFVISRLEEPMPTDKFKEVNPEKYDIVLKKPRFLFIEAIKK